MCPETIWKMLDEMNHGLEKLAEKPYEKIREYALKTKELKEGNFGLDVGIDKKELQKVLEGCQS